MTEVEKKKRGRKPKNEKETQQCVKESEKVDPQILHLNITRNIASTGDQTKEIHDSNLFESDFCNYKPDICVPNAYNENDTFSSQPYELVVNKAECNANSNVKVLLQNIDKHQMTNVACFWCCHKFDTPYLGLPLKYKASKFQVYGCFCSFECMCAYNFNSNEHNHNIWEIYNLINIMANILHYDRFIYPAPPRKCLSFFGGYMSIDEFRNFKNSKKIVNINNPPFIVVADQIEEINDFYHKQTESLFNFDNERILVLEKKISEQKVQDLQNNFKNTLDSTMNIKS
ncbi:hypothetical protein QKU58_gp135 [Pyramimonas orientalis virus]|uniref:MYM-type domain-containing protein n=1 Tax=Pyramimonas orientalis virus 01B TaxID=3134525 RepID=A0A7M3UNE7_9VIRU|nr:hypothetical protein QKU58_gp135 [Pyramimonas orientalis virus]QOI90196.1 hypothetical protein HWQ62_00059 [Pyramimonas orientalis virus]